MSGRRTIDSLVGLFVVLLSWSLGQAQTGRLTLTKDAHVKPESVQVIVDLVRESAKVFKPISAGDVADHSFPDKGAKRIGNGQEVTVSARI